MWAIYHNASNYEYFALNLRDLKLSNQDKY